MKPILHARSDTQDKLFDSLVMRIADIDCTQHFENHEGLSQIQQAAIVRDLQQTIFQTLMAAFPSVVWRLEYQPSDRWDSIDIFGEVNDARIVIELDKSRADQVAKKFLSRSAMFTEQIFYISVCYPAIERTNRQECHQYFGYCVEVSRRLGNLYAGFILQSHDSTEEGRWSQNG